MTTVERETRETRIRLQLDFGSGEAKAATGIPFLDHMIVTLARYSALDIQLEAAGDLKHHIIEVRFRAPCTITGCVPSATTPGRRSTSVSFAAMTATMSSKLRSRPLAWRCAGHSRREIRCSVPKVLSCSKAADADTSTHSLSRRERWARRERNPLR